MICYEVVTRQEVFQDARANIHILTNLIASRGQKPNPQQIEDAEKEVQHQNSKDIEIFQLLKYVMEKCWCFAPKDRFSMKAGELYCCFLMCNRLVY